MPLVPYQFQGKKDLDREIPFWIRWMDKLQGLARAPNTKAWIQLSEMVYHQDSGILEPVSHLGKRQWSWGNKAGQRNWGLLFILLTTLATHTGLRDCWQYSPHPARHQGCIHLPPASMPLVSPYKNFCAPGLFFSCQLGAKFSAPRGVKQLIFGPLHSRYKKFFCVETTHGVKISWDLLEERWHHFHGLEYRMSREVGCRGL